MLIRSRRDFLKAAVSSVGAVGAVGTLGKLGEINAYAAGSGYQALVCIYLAGGNDGHNTVIPITTAQQNYNLYQAGRGGLALSQASLKSINNGSDVYGLHPQLTEIQSLYNAGHAAVVANVGMLVKPIDRTLYNSNNSAIVPNALFSHSDQQSQWQSAIPTGLGSTGWGGRIADAVQGLNTGAQFPPMLSTAGNSLFTTGSQTFAANMSGANPNLLSVRNQASLTALQQLISFDNGMKLVQSANGIFSRGISYASTLNNALNGVTLTTQFPAGNQLAAQLQTVARIIKVHATLGVNRQIFYCTLGGFDTHGGQISIQDSLLQQLSQAVGAFYQATVEIGADQLVTTFTASEFGRTLTPNSNAGTDHAWGSHHFVIGGAVQGGKFYGQFPLLALGSQYDANNRGTLIPTTSVDQYAATMAQWFGVDAATTSQIFPYLANFPTSNLGLLG
jgi:uncharacterized protein (DUF1501 family)